MEVLTTKEPERHTFTTWFKPCNCMSFIAESANGKSVPDKRKLFNLIIKTPYFTVYAVVVAVTQMHFSVWCATYLIVFQGCHCSYNMPAAMALRLCHHWVDLDSFKATPTSFLTLIDAKCANYQLPLYRLPSVGTLIWQFVYPGRQDMHAVRQVHRIADLHAKNSTMRYKQAYMLHIYCTKVQQQSAKHWKSIMGVFCLR